MIVMKYPLNYLASVLFILCSSCSTGTSSSASNSSPKQDHYHEIRTRLEEMFRWYAKEELLHPLDIAWNDKLLPIIEGKEAYTQWIEDSGFFTATYAKRLSDFFAQCEKEGEKDPNMDHFGCLEQDPVVSKTYTRLDSLSNFEITMSGDTALAKFILWGTGSPETALEYKVKYPHHYALLKEGQKWLIDDTHTLDYFK